LRHLRVRVLSEREDHRLTADEGAVRAVVGAENVVVGAEELSPGDVEAAAGERCNRWQNFIVAGRDVYGDLRADAVACGVKQLAADGVVGTAVILPDESRRSTNSGGRGLFIRCHRDLAHAVHELCLGRRMVLEVADCARQSSPSEWRHDRPAHDSGEGWQVGDEWNGDRVIEKGRSHIADQTLARRSGCEWSRTWIMAASGG
jgi:hypothetical protein